MKTTKIIIAAVLVLLTLAINAQDKRDLFATIIYSHDMNRIETWVSNTIYTDYAEISFENEASFEQWMAAPFDEAIVEIDPLMESWMAKPFETKDLEDELSLESWMSSPFETDENIPIEDWMTASNW